MVGQSNRCQSDALRLTDDLLGRQITV